MTRCISVGVSFKGLAELMSRLPIKRAFHVTVSEDQIEKVRFLLKARVGTLTVR